MTPSLKPLHELSGAEIEALADAVEAGRPLDDSWIFQFIQHICSYVLFYWSLGLLPQMILNGKGNPTIILVVFMMSIFCWFVARYIARRSKDIKESTRDIVLRIAHTKEYSSSSNNAYFLLMVRYTLLLAGYFMLLVAFPLHRNQWFLPLNLSMVAVCCYDLRSYVPDYTELTSRIYAKQAFPSIPFLSFVGFFLSIVAVCFGSTSDGLETGEQNKDRIIQKMTILIVFSVMVLWCGNQFTVELLHHSDVMYVLCSAIYALMTSCAFIMLVQLYGQLKYWLILKYIYPTEKLSDSLIHDDTIP